MGLVKMHELQTALPTFTEDLMRNTFFLGIDQATSFWWQHVRAIYVIRETWLKAVARSLAIDASIVGEVGGRGGSL